MRKSMQLLTFMIMMVLVIAVFFSDKATVFAKDSSESSTIGGIEVTNVKRTDLHETLQNAINDWLSTPIKVSDRENTITLDASDLTFDIESAISQYETMTKKPWYAFWRKDKSVQLPLPVTLSEAAIERMKAMTTWDVDQTVDTLLTQANYLHNHEIEAVKNDLTSQLDERIAFQIEDIPSGAVGLEDAMTILNETILVPNHPVSLLTLLGDQVEAVNQSGLNFLASMLYSTVLQTEYEILERHPQAQLPAYLQPGMEALIDQTLAKDLQFVNLFEHHAKLYMTIEGNQAKVELFSSTREKEIKIHVEKARTVRPRTIYRYSNELAIGTETVVQEGKAGLRVNVYRLIDDERVLVSQDYYAPTNQIIVRSAKQRANSETTYEKDPDLEVDLDGNGLVDPPTQADDNTTNNQNEQQINDPEIVYGYYDKGGNFVQTSP